MKVPELTQRINLTPNKNEFTIHGNKTNSDNAKPAQENLNTNYIDMRNISLNDVNQLIRAGFSELLDVVPNIPRLASINLNSSGHSKNQEDYSDVKIDFIVQIEGYIEFEKSLGRREQALENFLEKIKKLHGMKMSKTIDERA